MRKHRISWIAFWIAGLVMFSADDELRCEVPRGNFTNVTTLGPPVSMSGVFEAAPSVSADGLTLYFGSERPGGAGNRDLYQATRGTVNDPFGDVTNLGLGINGSVTELAPAISSDGLTLYFASARSDGVGSNDIYQATRATHNDTFDNVTNLGAINTRFDDRPEHVSPDGLTLYFESTRPGGEGGFDLYTATRENLSAPFANVTNLGSGINGPTDEFGASVSSDGLTMFFGERGGPFRPAGQGDEDIWVAVRTSTDEQFSNVVNLNSFSLGSDVNSRFPELVPSISHDWPASGSQMYFNFNRGGSFDIWQATWVPEPILQAGDFDGDGLVSGSDIDLLSAAVGMGDTMFDLDGNGTVEEEDRRVWVEDVFGTFFGDADLNKEVAFADFLSLSDSFSALGGWATGDFDGNGDIQFADFLLLSANFGKSATAVAAVPEPNAAILLLVGLVSLIQRRWIVSESRGA